MNKIQISPEAYNKIIEQTQIKAINEVLEFLKMDSMSVSVYSKIFNQSRPTVYKQIKNGTLKLNQDKKIIITAESLPIGKQSEEGRSRIQAQRE